MSSGTQPTSRWVALKAWVGRARPGEPPHEKAEALSVEHLQELYTVSIGLALTVAVERLFPGELHGGLHNVAVVGFVAFLATVLPFYHGALRHLDNMYRVGQNQRSGGGLLFADFLALFTEACLLIAMAASLDRPRRVLILLLLLLLLDIVWLEFFVRVAAPRIRPDAVAKTWGHRAWVLVNTPFLILGVLLLLLHGGGAEEGALGLASLVGGLALARTVVDYAWSWRFYFPT